MKTKITFWLFLFCSAFTIYSHAAEISATTSNIGTVYTGASNGD